MPITTPLRPFIPYGRHWLDENDIQLVLDTLRHGALTQGPKIVEFEETVARYVNAKFAVAVSSGTAALHLACLAAEIGAGDRLITSPNTFVASSNAALYVGAEPHFSDIHPDTLNLDPALLEETCRSLKKVKALVPVHFAGYPCDMKAIKAVADRFGAMVIEDAAHALGSDDWEGGKIGNCSYSDMTVFSFHPVKLIAAGEGGMITTNDESLYRHLLRLRTHGITKSENEFQIKEQAFTDSEVNPWYYEMSELGFNYRITDIQSALAISQLKKIDLFIERRRKLVQTYDRAFSNLETATVPQKNGRDKSAHHIYVLRINFKALGLTRNKLMKRLKDKGVGSQVHYIPVHRQPYYQKRGFKKGQFPNAEHYYDEALSIPLFYGLSDDDQAYVCTTLKEFVR